MEQQEPVFVRGKCACGRRYRIRNATAGAVVHCPRCKREIVISADDVETASIAAGTIPIHKEHAEPKEALPIDHGELRLAADGSRPGLTGQTIYDHEEAMVANAVRGWSSLGRPTGGRRAGPVKSNECRRSFLHDVAASFYFAGHPTNALNLFGISVVYWVLFLISGLVGSFLCIGSVIMLFVTAYVVQFYWSVLSDTANGDDVIPLHQPDWTWWEDGFRPMLLLAAVSLVCSLPALIQLSWMGPSGSLTSPSVLALFFCGWFFWPVAALSVSVAGSAALLRPDWLVRCLLGIGPMYVLFWLMVVGAWLVGVGYWYWIEKWTGMPAGLQFAAGFLGTLVDVYVGYVVFRNIGLLYRHFGNRFPWKAGHA